MCARLQLSAVCHLTIDGVIHSFFVVKQANTLFGNFF